MVSVVAGRDTYIGGRWKRGQKMELQVEEGEVTNGDKNNYKG